MLACSRFTFSDGAGVRRVVVGLSQLSSASCVEAGFGQKLTTRRLLRQSCLVATGSYNEAHASANVKMAKPTCEARICDGRSRRRVGSLKFSVTRCG